MDERSGPARWEGPVLAALLVIAPAAKTFQLVRHSSLGWEIGRQALIVLVVGAVLALALRHHGRSLARAWTQATGLSRPRQPPSLGWTFLPVTAAVVGSFAGIVVSGRPNHLSLAATVHLLVLTAFGEELIYRGCLLALADRLLRPWRATLVTGLSFVAWHSGDMWNATHGPHPKSIVGTCLGTITLTFVGGIVFALLRRRTGSLLGPVLAHVASNLPGKAFVAPG